MRGGTLFFRHRRNNLLNQKDDVMGVLAWVLFGLIAGLIAKAIHPGKDPGGWLAAIIIGILGGVIGGWAGMALGWGDVDGFNIRSFLLAIAGSVLLLWIWAKVTRRDRVGHRRHLDAD